jgi:hypothetical protein
VIPDQKNLVDEATPSILIRMVPPTDNVLITGLIEVPAERRRRLLMLVSMLDGSVWYRSASDDGEPFVENLNPVQEDRQAQSRKGYLRMTHCLASSEEFGYDLVRGLKP